MKYRTRRSSGASAIAVTISPNAPWELEGVRLHLDAGGAATDFTVTMDSAYGSAHDLVLFTYAMSGVADVDYRWSPLQKFTNKNDKVIIAYANGGAAGWGLEVVYRILG